LDLTPENIELIILSIFKSEIYQTRKVLNIDVENLCFPQDIGDSDYEENSIDHGKINSKSGSSCEAKNINKLKSNSLSAPAFTAEAANLFNSRELISGNSQKAVDFKNLISLNIPGISDLNERGIYL
jgi:hypothetical protein